MQTVPLLENGQGSTTIEIEQKGRICKTFPRTYPEALRGVMEEEEYLECIDRIDKAARIRWSIGSIICSTILVLILILLLLIFGNSKGGGAGGDLCTFILFVAFIVHMCRRGRGKTKLISVLMQLFPR